MHEVVLYADDYALGIYSSGGIGAAWDYAVDHYLTWGGGYTAFIVIILIMFPPILWKLFLTLLLVAFVGLTVKMVCKNHPTRKWLIAILLWSLIFVLSIWISREVIYWLDGSVAYLFSMFQVFIFFYFMYTRLIQGITKKYDYCIIPLLAFFAGWSSAQSGLIAVIMCLLLLAWKQFIKKERVHKLYIISTISSVIGFCIFYFAPGNSARMDTFTEYANYNIFQKIAYRSSSVTGLIFNTTQAEFTAAPMFIYLTIGLTSIIDFATIKKETSKKLRIVRLVCSIYGIIFVTGFIISNMNIPGISTLLSYGYKYVNLMEISSYGIKGYLGILSYIAVILALIANIVNAFLICKRQNNPLLVVSLLMAYAAEFSMVMAPYSPLRTTFYTIAFLWIAISYLVLTSYENGHDILPIFLLIFITINLYLGITTLILYVSISRLFKSNNYTFSARPAILFSVCVFAALASANYTKVLIKYHENRLINEENISRIIDYKNSITDEIANSPNEQILYLIPPADEVYGFTGLAGIDWVENGVRLYFNLPPNVNLEYEGAQK